MYKYWGADKCKRSQQKRQHCLLVLKDLSSCLNMMKLFVPFIFMALFIVINGMPPIGRDYNTRCRCLQLESRIIPPDSLRSIKLIPEGPHCPDKEVIAGLTNGQKVCLNPRSFWVKKLINFVLEKQLHQQGGSKN